MPAFLGKCYQINGVLSLMKILTKKMIGPLALVAMILTMGYASYRSPHMMKGAADGGAIMDSVAVLSFMPEGSDGFLSLAAFTDVPSKIPSDVMALLARLKGKKETKILYMKSSMLPWKEVSYKSLSVRKTYSEQEAKQMFLPGGSKVLYSRNPISSELRIAYDLPQGIEWTYQPSHHDLAAVKIENVSGLGTVAEVEWTYEPTGFAKIDSEPILKPGSVDLAAVNTEPIPVVPDEMIASKGGLASIDSEPILKPANSLAKIDSEPILKPGGVDLASVNTDPVLMPGVNLAKIDSEPILNNPFADVIVYEYSETGDSLVRVKWNM